jgi:hypothetical protein
MKTYFVSGHLDLTKEEFDEHYVPKLAQAIEEGCHFVVGDAPGCDFMAQRFLRWAWSQRLLAGVHPHENFGCHVYHMLERPRHSFGSGYGSNDPKAGAAGCTAALPKETWTGKRGGWPLVGGFKDDEERDAAMTAASDDDIAWVRPSGSKRHGSGTRRNLERRAVQRRALRLAERATWPKGFIDDCTDDGAPALRSRPPSWFEHSAQLAPIPPGFRERYDAACKAYFAVRHELVAILAEVDDLRDWSEVQIPSDEE